MCKVLVDGQESSDRMNVEDIMTPRAEVLAVEIPGTRDDALSYLQDRAFSSVPAVKETENGEVFRGIVSRGALIERPDEDQLALLAEEVEPTTRDALDESMLLSGYDPDGDFLQAFYHETRGVRRLGSASLHLCFVAAGSADALWEYDTYPWDVAAGLCILREAGGRATDADGNLFTPSLTDRSERASLLASNGPLHGALLAHLPD